jgi:acyl-CoA synthetase (NDP forming)
VAVIGASADPASISGQPIALLQAKGYLGALYPVNPKHETVAGLACFASLDDLPETPDVVVVAVAAARVAEALEAIGQRGAPFAIVLSAGFAEIGAEGAAAQRRVRAIAARHGTCVIGPNCQGFMNVADEIHVGFGPAYAPSYRKGAVSLASQSGAFGNSVVMLAEAEGLGLRRYISTGNEAVTSTLDLFEYFLDDAGTHAIAGYIEGLSDARRLLDIGARALRAGKPILIWKVGNSPVGARAAATHTANLSGLPELYRAAFRQRGILGVRDVGDLADWARALLPGRLPHGNRIAVITISGGAGIVMADECTEAGLEIPELAPATLEVLVEALPTYASPANPVDMTASVLGDTAMFEATLEAVAADPAIDLVAVALAAVTGRFAVALATQMAAVVEATGKPLLVAWNGSEDTTAEAYAILESAGIPRYASPVRCAGACAALARYASAQRRQRVVDAERALRIERPAVAAELASSRGTLAEHEAKRVLAEYGIEPTREALALTAADAVRAAAALGGPVVLKIQSAGIPHKSEAGGVRIGLEDAAAIASAFDEIVARARAFAPDADIDGVLVQEQVVGAVEVIAGVTNDASFGPAIVFGLGGVHAEVLRDVSIRIAPITATEAREMIREIRGFAILDGARGRPRADLDALTDALLRLSAMAVDLASSVESLDVNPLFVLGEGGGVKAGDALITLRERVG